jgi:hypothetical protein
MFGRCNICILLPNFLVQLGPIHIRDLNVSRAVHISTFFLGGWLDGHESNNVICLCALLQTFLGKFREKRREEKRGTE